MSKIYDDILNSVYKDFFGTEAPKDAAKNDPNYKFLKDAMERGYSDLELEHTLDSLTGKIYGNGPVPSAFAGPADPAGQKGQEDTEVRAEETAAASTAAAEEEETDPMEELESLTGLTTIKADVKELVNFVKMQKIRKDKGMKTVPVSLHLVFSGNPGTGKTTVARLLARLYKKIGALSKGQLVEVDRSALVAGYVGQTAIQTQNKIQEALGGVLFIDEAYTLSTGGTNDFGQEAIDTILKAMEDHRDDLVVIVAGYTDLMKKFIDSNPGLKSRFNKYIEFPDYTAEELLAIFDRNLKKYEYTITDDCRESVKKHLDDRLAHKDRNFANAREVRNYFEEIITNQASRIASVDDPDIETLSMVTIDDLPEADRPKKAADSDNSHAADE